MMKNNIDFQIETIKESLERLEARKVELRTRLITLWRRKTEDEKAKAKAEKAKQKRTKRDDSGE